MKSTPSVDQLQRFSIVSKKIYHLIKNVVLITIKILLNQVNTGVFSGELGGRSSPKPTIAFIQKKI